MMKKVMLALVLAVMMFTWLGNTREADKSYVMYTAKSGETLWEIADRHYELTNTGMSFNEYEFNLRQENQNLQNKHRVLQPGDTVRVPVWRIKG